MFLISVIVQFVQKDFFTKQREGESGCATVGPEDPGLNLTIVNSLLKKADICPTGSYQKGSKGHTLLAYLYLHVLSNIRLIFSPRVYVLDSF